LLLFFRKEESSFLKERSKELLSFRSRFWRHDGQTDPSDVLLLRHCTHCSGYPMSLTIELLPEVEAGLSTLAAEQGMSLAQYARRLLEGQLAISGQATLSPAERASAWREAVRGLPRSVPLSDEAISRESIYDARG
jgi:hypothetical protein